MVVVAERLAGGSVARRFSCKRRCNTRRFGVTVTKAVSKGAGELGEGVAEGADVTGRGKKAKHALVRAITGLRVDMAAAAGERGVLGLAEEMPERYRETFRQLFENYKGELAKKYGEREADRVAIRMFKEMAKVYAEEMRVGYTFPAYHEAVRGPPFDYFALGNEYVSHLIDWRTSLVRNIDAFAEMDAATKRGENVFLLSNHQTEADAAFFPLLLDSKFPGFGERMVFVAGDRVVTDMLAKPFSMGRNLLCVHSKRHLDDDPSLKQAKRRQNIRSLREMERLLTEGGKVLWVAPSGGRDRRRDDGTLEPDRFDPSTVEMVRKIVNKPGIPRTRVHPFAMFTHDILPPPPSTQKDLGERRVVNMSKVGLSPAEEVDISDNGPWASGVDLEDLEAREKALSDHIYEFACVEYVRLVESLESSDNLAGRLPESCSRPWEGS